MKLAKIADFLSIISLKSGYFLRGKGKLKVKKQLFFYIL
ncbi:hypothetical protein BFG60_3422 [Microcystis aeruginosa NIES-98]|nr:hypothetical protein BFG60_3422 [Microcystis aeruginosa NIES-98]